MAVNWKAIRFGIIIFSFASSLLVAPNSVSGAHIGWVAVGIVIVVFPGLMLAGVGLLLLFRRKFDWDEPSWGKNPFSFGHGEQLFHLGAFVLLAQGMAMVLRSSVSASAVTPGLLMPVAAGAGIWAGLRALTAIHQWQVRRSI